MSACYLCKSSRRDDIQYGELLRNKNMAVHLFCLYLSSNLSQKGSDEEGFLGFLEADIVKESRRVSYLKCFYCRKPYANVGCCERKCQHAFHVICGLENGAENQFCNSFKSYCHSHIRKGHIRPPAKNATCVICYDNLFGPKERFSRLKHIEAPCCRNGWFHKLCLQKFAMTSGYFFKCPLCNDAKIFRQKLPVKGIYIPNQDAAWELEPNAFAELLERPSECSALKCENKEGRSKTSSGNPLIFCSTCGSTAMHKQCLPHRGSRFHCADCTVAMEERDSGRESFNSANCHNNDEEYEIDVCNVSDHEDLEIIRGLLPDDKPKCTQDTDSSSSEESIIISRRRTQTRILSGDSDCSERSKENRNPSAQAKKDKCHKELSKAKAQKLDSAAYTENETTTERQRRILHTIEDDEVEVIHDEGIRNSDGDADESKAIKIRNTVSKNKNNEATQEKEPHQIKDKRKRYDTTDSSDDGSKSEENFKFKLNLKRKLQVVSDEEDEDVQQHTANKQVRNSSATTRAVIDDDTDTDEDEDKPNLKENFKSSERDSSMADTTSDDESDEDDDPLENFTKFVEKEKKNTFVAQRTRKQSISMENPRQELNIKPRICCERETRKSTRITEQPKSIRFDSVPRNDSNKQDMDASCIAKRTRRKSMFCELSEPVSKEENVLSTSCVAVRTRGRRKTVCSQTATEKEKQQLRCVETESSLQSAPSTSSQTSVYENCETDEDTDNFIVPDNYDEEYEKQNTENIGRLRSFETSCIAKRTRKRTHSKPLVIEEETSSSCGSVASSSSSYYSTSANTPVTSSQESCANPLMRYNEKWPKQNVDKAYIKRNMGSSKSNSQKSYHPSNRHHPHTNNRRRI